MSNLAIFIIGFVILIGGLAYGANMAGHEPAVDRRRRGGARRYRRRDGRHENEDERTVARLRSSHSERAPYRSPKRSPHPIDVLAGG